MVQNGIVYQRQAGDLCRTPQRHFGVAMLADDVGVHRLRIDAVVSPQKRAETARIQHRAGADDPGRRSPADVLSDMGQDVHRVACDQEHRTRRVVVQLADDLFEHGGIAV